MALELLLQQSSFKGHPRKTYGCLQVIDPTSEVCNWPQVLKIDSIGFVSSWEARSLFCEALYRLEEERLGGPNDPPPSPQAHSRRGEGPHTGEI